MTTAGQAFFNRQVALLEKQDIDALIDTQYAPDAVLVGFGFTVRGHAALLQHFRNYMANLGYMKLISADQFTETDDSVFFEATVETARGIAVVYDVFILKNGKSTHHFTGLKEFRPNQG